MSNVETPDETPEESGNMAQEATDTIAHEAGEAANKAMGEIIHDAIDAAVKVANELNAELAENDSDAEGGGEE